jgi:hypothetical protein
MILSKKSATFSDHALDARRKPIFARAIDETWRRPYGPRRKITVPKPAQELAGTGIDGCSDEST